MGSKELSRSSQVPTGKLIAATDSIIGRQESESIVGKPGRCLSPGNALNVRLEFFDKVLLEKRSYVSTRRRQFLFR